MKKITLLISLLAYLWTFGQTPANDPHWQLVWEDNFNLFDANRWLKVDWAQHGEPQLYLADNVTVSNGNLVIKVNNNPIYCPPNPPTVWGACWPCDNQWYYYTSGWVETKQAYNTQYGYIESRIKLPLGYGFWPAFWTFVGPGLPSSSNAAEIDIFEMLGGAIPNPNNLITNYHLSYPSSNIHVEHIPVGFNYTDWHIYSIEWSPSKIIWYVDNSPIRILPNPGIIDPVRIILNLAIEPWAPPNQTTPFPSEMLVDYVRVYELDNDCNTNINVCNYNFSTHNNKVKKNITIGNGTCTNTISSGQNVYLRASEGVLINGDFSISLGSELYIDVNSCY